MLGKKSQLGVSIVICCHNSSAKIRPTLEHLLNQNLGSEIDWEVLLIDNASTDNTIEIVNDTWKSKKIKLRIINEPKMGLIYARLRGFLEAKYEFISFIDDDNWVSSNWVERVYRIMLDNPEIGACGGICEPIYEENPPEWFHNFTGSYAIGWQGEKSGDVTNSRGFLWGAGLSIRFSAWQSLKNYKFTHLLIGRTGQTLSSGEDQELCYALKLAGWKLWFDTGLKLSHFISSERLDWKYLRQLRREFGKASVSLSIYEKVITGNYNQSPQYRGILWLYETIMVIMSLLKKIILNPNYVFSNQEGNPEILSIERLFGQLSVYLQMRKDYDNKLLALAKASWPLLE